MPLVNKLKKFFLDYTWILRSIDRQDYTSIQSASHKSVRAKKANSWMLNFFDNPGDVGVS